MLNRMWRNTCINDTYEPGSTFKIITASAGLEAGVVTLQDQFSCPGFRVVEDRRIHCARRTGHGAQTFVQGIENSCNPVFIDVALRLGVENITIIFKNSVYWKKQVLICREKREPLCIKKKISDRWNWQLSHSVSHSRLLLCSWQRQPPL